MYTDGLVFSWWRMDQGTILTSANHTDLLPEDVTNEYAPRASTSLTTSPTRISLITTETSSEQAPLAVLPPW